MMLLPVLLAIALYAPDVDAQPLYCEAWTPVAGGSLEARVFPPNPDRPPLFNWSYDAGANGRVTLYYRGEAADLTPERLHVVIDKSGSRSAARALHMAGEGGLTVRLGERPWPGFWRDGHRWDDPRWVMIARVDLPQATAEGPLTLNFTDRRSRPVHALTLGQPSAAELRAAAERSLAEAREKAKTGKGCVVPEIDVESVMTSSR